MLAALLVVILIWIGARLGGAITDQMEQIWDAEPQQIPALPSGGVYALRTHWLYRWTLHGLKRHVIPAFSVVAILYCALALTSHLLFNLQDAAGMYCKESATVRTVPWLQEITAESSYRANDFCWGSGIYLTEGRRYQVTITQTSAIWRDGSPLNPARYDTDLAGFEISEVPGFANRVALFLAVPLRRVFLRPWFRVIGRIGAVGTDEYFMDPDKPTVVGQGTTTQISPAFRVRRDGELFLYVNDAAIGWPGVADLFYRNNEGETTVVVRHLPR